MKRMGVIICLVLAVLILLTLPSISAVESNTLSDIKKSFLSKIPDLIKDRVNNKLFLKYNHSILIIVISILLDLIAYRLIKQNYTEIALMILFSNLLVVNRYMD